MSTLLMSVALVEKAQRGCMAAQVRLDSSVLDSSAIWKMVARAQDEIIHSFAEKGSNI